MDSEKIQKLRQEISAARVWIGAHALKAAAIALGVGIAIGKFLL